MPLWVISLSTSWGTVYSALVLHEPLSPAGLAGAALVLGATLLSELWARKKPT